MNTSPNHRRNEPCRHTAFIRITHWINAISFLFLVPSGIAILIAHPEFYLGDTGYFGDPAILTIPVEQNVDHTGWGRGMHFFFAWMLVLNGLVYVLGAVASGHVRDEMLSARPAESDSVTPTPHYNPAQRVSYLVVMFVLLPLMLFTGLAMSPAVVAAFPDVFSLLGGRQTARTLHFAFSVLLLVFFTGHIAMLLRDDPINRLRSMITGRGVADRRKGEEDL